MTRSDLPAAIELWAAAFNAELPDEEARANTAERLAYSLETDPRGSFAAESQGELVGLAQALLREQLWVLSSLAVLPGGQGRGAGGLLLERALAFGAGARCQLVVSSNDPRALALYARVGLELRPTVQGEGQVDARMVASLPGACLEGGPRDVSGLEEISRAIRGAPHTAEILYALRAGARLLLGERGFSVVRRQVAACGCSLPTTRTRRAVC